MSYKKSKTYIRSSKSRLRLSVHRSNTNIYAQIINDEQGITVAAASSLKISGNKLKKSQEVGALIAKQAKKNNIQKVVFDRGQYVYKGRIKACADAARQNGLEF